MKYYLVAILILAYSFSGCKKSKDDINNVNTGVISGEVRLTDEFGNELPQHNNLTVSTQTGQTGVTLNNGTFKIENLPTGIYQLTYKKDSVGTYKKFDIAVNAGANGTVLNGINYLGKKSTTLISALNVSFSSVDSTYNIGCTINPVPDSTHQRAFRLFFSKTNDVSSSNFLYNPSNSWVATTGSGVISGFQRISFYSNGFSPGDSVYVVSYGEAIITNVYTDPMSGNKVYPNLNINSPSNIVGFVLQ